MAKTCKTCKHWNYRSIECEHGKWGDRIRYEAAFIRAEGGGRIFTGPNYGCIHYKKNKKKSKWLKD